VYKSQLPPSSRDILLLGLYNVGEVAGEREGKLRETLYHMEESIKQEWNPLLDRFVLTPHLILPFPVKEEEEEEEKGGRKGGRWLKELVGEALESRKGGSREIPELFAEMEMSLMRREGGRFGVEESFTRQSVFTGTRRGKQGGRGRGTRREQGTERQKWEERRGERGIGRKRGGGRQVLEGRREGEGCEGEAMGLNVSIHTFQSHHFTRVSHLHVPPGAAPWMSPWALPPPALYLRLMTFYPSLRSFLPPLSACPPPPSALELSALAESIYGGRI
jgi:hypothetical protein